MTDLLSEALFSMTLESFQAISFALDVWLRSLAIFLIAVWFTNRFEKSNSLSTQYSQWFYLLLVLSIVPCLPLFLLPLKAIESTPALFTVLLPSSARSDVGWLNLSSVNSMLIVGFAIGVAVNLSRLVISLVKLGQLKRDASYQLALADKRDLQDAVKEFAIRRQVSLGISDEIVSPISFGWIKPIILVPQSWAHWPHETRICVIHHELAHVHRRDWLTSLVMDVIVCVQWVNPLLWLARQRALNTAEKACDQQVLNNGIEPISYANVLLGLARRSHTYLSPRHAMAMVTTGELTERVDEILDHTNQTRRRHIWKAGFPMILVLLALASVRFVAVEDAADFRNVRALHTPSPVYPTLLDRMRGHTRLRFDVDERGNVDPDSIEVVYSSNPELLSGPSIDALKRYEFEPAMAWGKPTRTRGLESNFTVTGYVAFR